MDSGYLFSVEATLDGCAEMSASILVDGWIFLPPFAMNGGDPPYMIDNNGTPHHCAGDFVTLTLGMPYDTNIQWTHDGQPIPGADQPELVVIESGSYHVFAAPALCPDFIQPLGVEVTIVFTPPLQPVIIMEGDLLCADPPADTHQWYLNGDPLAGATAACIEPSAPGAYTVEAFHDVPCLAISEPWLVTGVAGTDGHDGLQLFPNPASSTLWVACDAPAGTWRVFDLGGRALAQGRLATEGATPLELGMLAPGAYLMQVMDAQGGIRTRRFLMMH
jgi:hypothetical protein